MNASQQSLHKNIKSTCPACGKIESIQLSESDIVKAKRNHKLIPKAIVHHQTTKGHIFAMYIDPEGNIRRRYSFEILDKNRSRSFNKSTKTLEIFAQIFEAARNTD